MSDSSEKRSELSPYSTPLSPYSSPPLAGSAMACGHCQAENRADARFCWLCGYSFSGLAAYQQSSSSGKSALRIVLFVIMLPLSLIGGATVALFIACILSL